MTVDCKACGACCVGEYDDGLGFADVLVDDMKRMSRHVKARMNGVPMTPGVMTERWGKVCGFLRGTPGKRTSCGIYESRPSPCRAFRVGSAACIKARRELREGSAPCAMSDAP